MIFARIRLFLKVSAALIRTLILLQKKTLWPDLKRILLFRVLGQQVNDAWATLYSNGQKIPSEFKSMQNKIWNLIKNWLNTNALHVIRQFPAENGRNSRPKDIFPLLKYLTIGDERVRRSHKDLDEVVLSRRQILEQLFSMNDYGTCRCTTWTLWRRRNNDRPDKFEDNPDLFKMNAGKDKIIFREDVHPYLKLTNVTKSRSNWNFDLPFVPWSQRTAVKRK
jgi:hypothetical protein